MMLPPSSCSWDERQQPPVMSPWCALSGAWAVLWRSADVLVIHGQPDSLQLDIRVEAFASAFPADPAVFEAAHRCVETSDVAVELHSASSDAFGDSQTMLDV